MAGVQINSVRRVPILHRLNVTAVDKLAIMGAITPTAITGGFLANSTPYFYAAIPFNKQGSAGTPLLVFPSLTTGASGTAMRLAFAQVPSADGYDLFLATAAAPLWVGRITEAQRASGILVGVGNVVGVTGVGGAAGSADVLCVGSGLSPLVAPFTSNNAYTPGLVVANPGAGCVGSISCAGATYAHIKTNLAWTDLRSLPSLTIAPFLLNANDNLHDQCQLITIPTATTTGQSGRQDYVMQVDGSTGLVVCIDAIAGQGAACTIVVELS